MKNGGVHADGCNECRVRCKSRGASEDRNAHTDGRGNSKGQCKKQKSMSNVNVRCEVSPVGYEAELCVHS
eukprot:scaffold75451_cov21-Tisochrysis_lutea.AAC.1